MNVPLDKLSNMNLKQFLEKNVPDRTTLRRVNVKYCNQEVITERRQKVTRKKIRVATSSDMTYLKFSPTTSADFRTVVFFLLKYVSTKQGRFDFENHKKSLIVNRNNFFFLGKQYKFNVIGDGWSLFLNKIIIFLGVEYQKY